MYAYSLPGEPPLTLEEFLQGANLLCDEAIGKYYKFAAARGVPIGKLKAHIDAVETRRAGMSRAFGGIATGKYTVGWVEDFILACVEKLEVLNWGLDKELMHLEIPLPPGYTPVLEAVDGVARSPGEGGMMSFLLRVKGRAKSVCTLKGRLSVKNNGQRESGEAPPGPMGVVPSGVDASAGGSGSNTDTQPGLHQLGGGFVGFGPVG